LNRKPHLQPTVVDAPPAKSRKGLLIAIGVLLFGFFVFGYALSKNYEVLAEGQLLPYTEGDVARVRFFDSFTVWIGREPARLLDVVTTVGLSMLAGISLLALVLGMRRPGTPGRVQAFFVVTLFGAGYLAADEAMSIHETIGHNMQFLMDLPGVHRPDDAIFAAYVIPAVLVLIVFSDIIRASKTGLWFFAAAIALFAGAAFFDVVGVGIDELIEPLCVVAIIGGFTAVAVERLE
jgi:hypothetical protein